MLKKAISDESEWTLAWTLIYLERRGAQTEENVVSKPVTLTNSNLPPKLQPFASLLDAQPPEVQGAFQFLLATAMHEAGKFELVSVARFKG